MFSHDSIQNNGFIFTCQYKTWRLKLDMRFCKRAHDTRSLGHTHRPENNWIMRNWTSYEIGLCVDPTYATYHPWKYLSRPTVLWTQQIHVVISYMQKTAWYSAWTQWFRVASDEQRTFLFSVSYYLYMNTENVCLCVQSSVKKWVLSKIQTVWGSRTDNFMVIHANKQTLPLQTMVYW